MCTIALLQACGFAGVGVGSAAGDRPGAQAAVARSAMARATALRILRVRTDTRLNGEDLTVVPFKSTCPNQCDEAHARRHRTLRQRPGGWSGGRSGGRAVWRVGAARRVAPRQ